MAGERQANIRSGRHGERLGDSLLRPDHAIGRTVSGEIISTSNELEPIRRAQAGGGGVAAVATSARPVLPGHTVVRSYRDISVDRVGIQAVADHDSGF